MTRQIQSDVAEEQREDEPNYEDRNVGLWLFTMGTLTKLETPILENLQALSLIPGFNDISDYISEKVRDGECIAVPIRDFIREHQQHQNLLKVVHFVDIGEECVNLDTTCLRAALLMYEGDQQALHEDFFKLLGVDGEWLTYIYAFSLLQNRGVPILPSISMINKLRPNGMDLDGVVTSFHGGLLLSESLANGAQGTPLVGPLFMKFIQYAEQGGNLDKSLTEFFPGHAVGQIISTQLSESARRLLCRIGIYQLAGLPILRTLRILDAQENGVLAPIICSLEGGNTLPEALETNRADLTACGFDHTAVAVFAEVGDKIGDLSKPLLTLSGLPAWKN